MQADGGDSNWMLLSNLDIIFNKWIIGPGGFRKSPSPRTKRWLTAPQRTVRHAPLSLPDPSSRPWPDVMLRF